MCCTVLVKWNYVWRQVKHFHIYLLNETTCQHPAICFTVLFFFPMCVVQWKREQEFDLQLLERAVQGEEAQGVRSVQGEERPPEHKERPRSHSDEWLTFRSTATVPPTHEVDLEPLEYDLDLNKEVQLIFVSVKKQLDLMTLSWSPRQYKRVPITLLDKVCPLTWKGFI